MLFSEPKIPQRKPPTTSASARYGFSALQRAENSSKVMTPANSQLPKSRFSALQRAENSSNQAPTRARNRRCGVSVLFSEPKIPQNVHAHRVAVALADVSVLFSEPKIPQTVSWDGSLVGDLMEFQCSSASRKFLKSAGSCTGGCAGVCFSALQRAENSSNPRGSSSCVTAPVFQCSSASRKFLKVPAALDCCGERDVSVLFSEPKIPQKRESP